MSEGSESHGFPAASRSNSLAWRQFFAAVRHLHRHSCANCTAIMDASSAVHLAWLLRNAAAHLNSFANAA